MGNYVLNELQAFLKRLEKAQTEMSTAQSGCDFYSFDASWDNVKSICHPKLDTNVTHAITEARRFLAAQAGDQKKPKPYRSKWEKACKFEDIPTDPEGTPTKGGSQKKIE